MLSDQQNLEPLNMSNNLHQTPKRMPLTRSENVSRVYEVELDAQKKYLEDVIIMQDGREIEEALYQKIRRQIFNPKIINLTSAKNKINREINRIVNIERSKKKRGSFFTRKKFGWSTGGSFRSLRNLRKKNKTHKVNNNGQSNLETPVTAKWIYCEKPCVKVLLPLVKAEINSTAFMLRVLSGSVIDTTTNNELPLKFKYDNPQDEPLSGIWMNGDNQGGDHRFFKLDTLDPQCEQSRLIMGLGPSASGKTYWAKNIIKLMIESSEQTGDESFPRSFLSVDGGLMRELSFVYQCIIDLLSENPHIEGFENLVSSGLDPFHTSLFTSGSIKKKVKKYLKSQKKSDKPIPVSLYVPETLGSPTNDGFQKGVQPYINITEDFDNWIGLYIWQGKTPEDERVWEKAYKEKYKEKYPELNLYSIGAVSTTTSGKMREKMEGKKYSSSAYNYSRKHGLNALTKAPGARIDIHNSGGKKTDGEFNKTVVTEYKNREGEYVLDQNMLYKFNSIYLQKEISQIKQLGGNKSKRNHTKRKKHTKKNRI